MCGRYALFGPVSRLNRQFGVADDSFVFPPRYNIAPTQAAPLVRSGPDGQRGWLLARWGLRPGWVREAAKLPAPINAKAETAHEKAMFRSALRKSRVLVPTSGFYEWQPLPGGKQPHFIRRRDQETFAFGGLLERWQGPEGELFSYCILTTAANALLARIDNRMPVIIAPDDYAAWLDPKLTDPAGLQGMLGPYPEAEMEAFPVSTRVNRATAEGAELVDRVEEAEG